MSAPDTPESVRELAARLDEQLTMSMFPGRQDLYREQERQREEAAAMLRRYAAALPVIEAARAWRKAEREWLDVPMMGASPDLERAEAALGEAVDAMFSEDPAP